MTVEEWVRRCVAVRREVELDRMQMPDVITALADQRAELVALLTDTTVHGGTCDGIDSEDDTVCLSADDPLYHECTDVDEHQSTPCWGHQVRALLARIGVTP